MCSVKPVIFPFASEMAVMGSSTLASSPFRYTDAPLPVTSTALTARAVEASMVTRSLRSAFAMVSTAALAAFGFSLSAIYRS